MIVQSVLLVRACGIVTEHIFPSFKLGNVFGCMSECIVDRLIGTDGKNDVGTSSCKNRIQECVGIDDLHIDLDSGLGSEGIIYHRLKDGTLVTSGGNPYLNGIFAACSFINVTYGIVVDYE